MAKTLCAPTTSDVLVEMLTENTGKALCDSGDAYGRNWERNQGKTLDTFKSRPATTVNFKYGYIDFTIDVYHFLNERLEYLPELDQMFQVFMDESDDYWLSDMEAFYDHLEDCGYDVSEGPYTVNTFNGEDALTQVIQYTIFYLNSDLWQGYIVLLQIHGGCDVRGGYTKPRAFGLSGDDCSMYDNTSGTLYCSGCKAFWYTDDTYHWYPDFWHVDFTSDATQDTSLFNRDEFFNRDEYLKHFDKELQDYDFEELDDDQQPVPTDNVLWYDDDGNGYCPLCGSKIAC
jgi:hypothetical protein